MITPSLAFFAVALGKLTLLFAGVLILVLLLRKAEPRWRVLLVRAAVLTVPILLLAETLAPRVLLSSHWLDRETVRPAVDEITLPSVATGLPVPAADSFASAPATIPFGAWLLAGWLVMALAATIRELRQRRQVSRELKGSRPARAELVAVWSECCAEIGVRPSDLRESHSNQSPFLAPGRRGALVMPAALAETGSATLKHVFRHEAAHLKNGDAAWIPGLRWVTAVFWFHPLAWGLVSEHLKACEQACDAEAARLGGTEAYRGALAALALKLIPARNHVAATFLRTPSVISRLRSISRHVRLRPPSRWFAGGLAITTVVAGGFLGSIGFAQEEATASAAADLMRPVVIPKVEFSETEFEDAIEFLRRQRRELDPDGGGVNVLIATSAKPKGRITLSLTNVPFKKALWYVVQLAGLELRTDPSTLVIVPKGQGDGTLTAAAQVPGVAGQGPSAEPDAVRRELLQQIDAHGEEPSGAAGAQAPSPLQKRLSTIIIPKLDFRDVTLADALDFMRAKAQALDPNGAGVDFIATAGVDTQSKITLRLSNVPLVEAIRYTTELTGTRFTVESQAVVIRPKSAPGDLLYTKAFAVGSARAKALAAGKSAEEILTAAGVPFPAGAACIFNAETNQLVARHTKAGLTSIEEWLASED